MADQEQEFLIKILTAYETGGQEAALKAMRELNQEADKSDKSAGRAHGNWRAWMHTIHGSAQLAEGKLQGLGSALHGVSQLLGGMAGLGVGAVIGLAGGAIASVVEHWEKARAKIAEAAVATEAYAAKEQDIAERKVFDERIKDLERMKTAFEEAAAAAEKLIKAQEKNKSSDDQLALAQLEENKQRELANAKTPLERAEIEKKYAAEKVQLENAARVNKELGERTELINQQQTIEKQIANLPAEAAPLKKLADEAAAKKSGDEAVMKAAGIERPELLGKEEDRKKKIEELRKNAADISVQHLEPNEQGDMVIHDPTPADLEKANVYRKAADALMHYETHTKEAADATDAFEKKQKENIGTMQKLAHEHQTLGVEIDTANKNVTKAWAESRAKTTEESNKETVKQQKQSAAAEIKTMEHQFKEEKDLTKQLDLLQKIGAKKKDLAESPEQLAEVDEDSKQKQQQAIEHAIKKLAHAPDLDASLKTEKLISERKEKETEIIHGHGPHGRTEKHTTKKSTDESGEGLGMWGAEKNLQEHLQKGDVAGATAAAHAALKKAQEQHNQAIIAMLTDLVGTLDTMNSKIKGLQTKVDTQRKDAAGG